MGINDKLSLKPQRGLEVTALLILVVRDNFRWPLHGCNSVNSFQGFDNLFDNSRGMLFALARFPIKIKKRNSIPNYSQHH